ncbi:transglutaminase family protein [Streptomyces verrucosisporus]|uniref:transglutaminase family protein n=1 Tax=Streptomyces verrucosisporus TaxID=1695161 RepID=UPI0019D06818|nr:transglutaminase-like domain-containing protein [Streptomyces verrucosisporus]MBN3930504.1 transglutaminase family protein [Streptomyces verrucosisporus]
MDSPDTAGTDSARDRFARAARAERPDLALLCLLIGAEADPGIRTEGGKGVDGLVDAAQIELDRLTGLLPYAPSRTPAQWAHALAELLGGRHGFRGVPADYRRLDSSLLNEVLRRRRGLPILLSVVWMEVARRAGAPVYGVALPGHFVVGFGDPRGEHVLADPFAGGLPLTGQDVELLVASTAGTPLSEAMLQPAGPVEIVLRVLNNIRAWAAARPEHTDVQLWAVELSLLLPHHPARLRYERARLLVERGDFTGGARELEEYADMVAAMEPNAAVTVRREARAARSRLN